MHIRLKIIGTRAEVGEMWAIGSIREDFLGYFGLFLPWLGLAAVLTFQPLAHSKTEAPRLVWQLGRGPSAAMA